MNIDFKNKVVVITGASSGIGLACAREFASRGANLALAARKFVTLCEICRDLEKEFGIRAVAIATDVADEESCKVMIDQALSSFKRLDILVNNAGISMRALFENVDLSVLKKVMDVNFWGTVYCTKYALPAILKSKGTVVGVSSIAGYKGLPGRSGYSASKFAMQGFLEVLRLENRKKGIHVLIACPGFTASNIRKVALDQKGESLGETNRDEGSMMSAEEVAKRIVEAVAAKKPNLILTSQGKLMVFLSKFLPGLTDRLVYKSFTKESNPLIS